jgi:hypothetical protein
MTAKQADLLEFLRLHGPAQHVRGNILKGAGGFEFRISKSWIKRLANDGLVTRKWVRSPKFRILTRYYDLPDSFCDKDDR